MTRRHQHLRAAVSIWALAAAAVLSLSAGDAQARPMVGMPATQVALGQPEDIAFGTDGTMYVSEFSGNRVDSVATGGMLAVVAGTGKTGAPMDGGAATEARLNAPTGVIAESDGSLLIADHHHGCIRRVSPTGTITSVVGRCGNQGFSGDGGPAKAARLHDPMGIAEDRFGDLYIADEQNGRLRRVSPDGVVTTVAGGGSIPIGSAPDGTLGTEVALSHPSYLAINPAGDVYMSDFWANVVIRVDPNDHISHVAGTGVLGFSGDGGAATSAQLDFPTGLALTGSGALYIDDSFNNRIRRVSPGGVITTVVGTGTAGFSGDGGPAVDATVNAPSGLALGPGGLLYIADQANNVVRVVNRDGTIRTVAGVAPPHQAR
jgi:trimeric autotransporter adhesin